MCVTDQEWAARALAELLARLVRLLNEGIKLRPKKMPRPTHADLGKLAPRELGRRAPAAPVARQSERSIIQASLVCCLSRRMAAW